MDKLPSRTFKLALTSMFSLLLFACSSNTVVESDLGIKGAPDWVNEGKQAFKDGKNRFFRGIGSAPSMNDASLQKNTADNRARAELAQIFSSYMDVVASDYSAAVASSDDIVNEQAVSRNIKNITKLNLTGAEIIAHWQDKKSGVIYSLAEIDMNKFKTVATAAENMDPKLKQFIENKADNIFDAMNEGTQQ
ncbi:hypothetical protein [Teredinibacter franksiae]|uniref:hypothetical protein n=1 Tax=Teredinibacter franksiae TaxID=2761453 RepID=UPI0016253CC6|nr:hypothetical protein [Teredinibacter franksiae]